MNPAAIYLCDFYEQGFRALENIGAASLRSAIVDNSTADSVFRGRGRPRLTPETEVFLVGTIRDPAVARLYLHTLHLGCAIHDFRPDAAPLPAPLVKSLGEPDGPALAAAIAGIPEDAFTHKPSVLVQFGDEPPIPASKLHIDQTLTGARGADTRATFEVPKAYVGRLTNRLTKMLKSTFRAKTETHTLIFEGAFITQMRHDDRAAMVEVAADSFPNLQPPRIPA